MNGRIIDIVEHNEYLRKFNNYSKAQLQLMRMYLNFEMAYITEDNGMSIFNFVKDDDNENKFIDNILANKYRVDNEDIIFTEDLNKIINIELSKESDYEKSLKKDLGIFINEIDKYNDKSAGKLEYVEVIDYILNRKVPAFKNVVALNFFENIDLIDLLYVYVILESDLVNLNNYDECNNIVEIDYLNIISKNSKDNYMNILFNYYKNKENAEYIKLDIKNLNNIFHEGDYELKIYKIAAFFKYLIEIKKIDIIITLRELLKPDNIYKGMKIRAHYYKYKTFNKVEKMPYSQKTKNEIYKILYYILNYRYNENMPYVPINILMYSTDKEAVEYIGNIIGSFMLFFGYIQSSENDYYDEYLNDVILDVHKIKKVYYENDKPKKGMLLLHNFENFLYVEDQKRNLLLNILTDEMDKNNNKVCTILYGEKIIINQILDKCPKLSKKLINLELEIDDLEEKEISKIITDKLDKKVKISADTKKKIEDYIKATYRQSDIKNLDYINQLYNTIILNSSSELFIDKELEIKSKSIPQTTGMKDLSEILQDLNNLIGLTTIKEQINDLVYLLKFNKNAQIDLGKINLHMIFEGNPGTGKTTVARLITDILYNLGYINKNKLVEVSSRDLIAMYIGQTQEKTYNVMKSALDGVLFIDEAYSIAMVHEYGDECIATIIKMMEDYKDRLVVIFAGYEKEMEDFKNTNAGLASRIGYKIQFPDYKVEELMLIYSNLLEKSHLKITDKAKKKVEKIINEVSKVENFGNARFIMNIYQKILVEHAKNIEIDGKRAKDLYLINEDDINIEKLKVESKENESL